MLRPPEPTRTVLCFGGAILCALLSLGYRVGVGCRGGVQERGELVCWDGCPS
jgi:hypothetical protein